MHSTWRPTAAVAAAALLVAACGPSTNGVPAFSLAATGDPIKIMQIYSGQGAGFAGFDHVVSSTKAAVQAVNDGGGVNGHPLQLEVCDDAFQSDIATRCGQQAVHDKVTAVVGASSGVGGNWMPALTNANIPCVGCGGYSSAEATSPLFFAVGPSTVTTITGEGAAACALGAKHPAVAYATHSSGAFLVKSFNNGLALCGLQAKEIPLEQGAADFTDAAQTAVEGGTDLIASVIGQPDLGKFRAAIAATGRTPITIDGSENAYGDYYAAAPSLNAKTYIAASVVPAQIDDPSTRQFNAEIDKYAPNAATVRRTEAAESAWAAVHILAQLLTKAKGTDAGSLLSVMQAEYAVQYGPTTVVNWTHPLDVFMPLVTYTTKTYLAKVVGSGQLVPAVKGGFFEVTRLPQPAS